MLIKFYKKNFLLILLFFNTALRRMIITSIIDATTIDESNNYYHKVYGRSAVLDDGRLGNDYQRGTLYPCIIIESDNGNIDRQTICSINIIVILLYMEINN